MHKRVADFLLARMNERSFWTVTAPALLALVGVAWKPEHNEQILTIGAFAAGLITALMPDGQIVRKD